MTVEDTFRRWKGRYTRFRNRLDKELASAVDVIHASCVLHNICKLQKKKFMPNWKAADALQDAVIAEPMNEIEAQHADNILDALTEYFSYNSFQSECLMVK